MLLCMKRTVKIATVASALVLAGLTVLVVPAYGDLSP